MRLSGREVRDAGGRDVCPGHLLEQSTGGCQGPHGNVEQVIINDDAFPAVHLIS